MKNGYQILFSMFVFVFLSRNVEAAESTFSHPTQLVGSRPNILFIITDDQGYGDISAHGNPILKTPNLDKLHAESRRFTAFVVSPTCAPTRSALMTGRHEFHNGITHTILQRERLRLDAIPLPIVLKRAGYATGIFGKWHLGDELDYQPNRRGFDEVFIHGAGGIGQSYGGSCGDAPGNTYFNPMILHNGTFVKTEGYCTDVFFRQATQWISERTAQANNEPWFCWIATNAPHAPYNAKPEDKALYEGLGLKKDTESFFGMVHNIDENLGRLLQYLESKSLRQNTLVVFVTDNGGTAGVPVFNANMRGQKGSPWMGGTRACSFWSMPNAIQPGDCNRLTSATDAFRTLTQLAGARLTEAESTQAMGRSLIPLLENPTAEWSDRELITHVGRWEKGANPDTHKYRNCAIRNHRYALVSIDGGSQPQWQLFDLEKDPGQKKNIAMEEADTLKRLASQYDQWWDRVQVDLVNESAPLEPENTFKVLFEKQFGK
jgi:arylsulfatase A-like enzyme